MASKPAVTDAAGVALECDRLDVYRVAREFDAHALRIFPRRGHSALRGQLQRASASIVLNIAEGCGRFARAEKAHFYRIALGSAMECAAILDMAFSRGAIGSAACFGGRGLLVRVVQMLTKLARRMQG
jgi:four helix bundle protein